MKLLACDTETVHGKPWCVQFSQKIGTGYMIMADDQAGIAHFKSYITQPDVLTVFHNALFDVRVLNLLGITPANWTDTMVMAYLLQSESKGLKALAYRHCNMKMQTYEEVTRPASERFAYDYLSKVLELTWPNPEPFEYYDADGTIKVKKGQNIAKKVLRALSDYAKGEAVVDLRERWSKMEGTAQVEAVLGPMLDGTLADIPFDQARVYACKDPDATLGVYHALYPMIEDAGLVRTLERDIACQEMVLDFMKYGVLTDLDHFRMLSEKYAGKMKELQAVIDKEAGRHINVNSSEQVGEFLFKKNIIGKENKLSKLTGEWEEGYESTAADVLDKLKPRYPIVRTIQAFRSYSKLKSTYTDAIPLHADQNHRVHSDFSMTRTDTGRLASSKPNIQNQPTRSEDGKDVRAGFIAQPGCVQLSIDLCVTGDTEIVTTKGVQQIKDVEVGTGVLSCVNGEKLSMQRIIRKAEVGLKDTTLLITDDGSCVCCTPEHKWMLYDGRMIETRCLKQGDRLAHVKNGYTGKVEGQYQTWYIKSHINYLKKHIAVCEFVNGPRPENCHADHIDGDTSNWVESNVRWLNSKENFAQGGKRYWSAVKSNKRNDTNRLNGLKVGLSKRRSYKGEDNPRYGYRSIGDTVCINCGKIFYQPKCRKAKYCSMSCYNSARVGQNHKVAEIIPMGEQVVYQITVENTHTYVLSNGLVSGNSQIEMRIQAHESGDRSMVATFNDPNGDIHTETAINMFPHVEKIDKDKHRYPAKRTGFGVMYGISAMGLYDVFVHEDIYDFSEDDCQGFIDRWYRAHPGVRDWQDEIHGFAIRHGWVEDLFGRKRWVPEAQSSINKVREAGLRKAVNAPIQMGAQEVIKEIMVITTPIYKDWNRSFICRPLMQVHDELLFEVEEDKLDKVVGVLVPIFEYAVRLKVPVKCDAEVGYNWRDQVDYHKKWRKGV